jgi:hypothetical protein
VTTTSLATFVMIGPGEAGTTWVYGLLKAHPEVCVATAKKTMFFDASYHKGVDWYHRLYPRCDGCKAVGEVSNSYIFSEEAPARMRAYNPALKARHLPAKPDRPGVLQLPVLAAQRPGRWQLRGRPGRPEERPARPGTLRPPPWALPDALPA